MPQIPDGLPSIGKATKILLESHGIETALDVWIAGDSGYDGIPGLGPAKWAVLWMWANKNLDANELALIIRQRLGDPKSRSNIDHHCMSENDYREIKSLISQSQSLPLPARQWLNDQVDQWMEQSKPYISRGKIEDDERSARWKSEAEAKNRRDLLFLLMLCLPFVGLGVLFLVALSKAL